jgi:hypothetical protein
MIMMECRGCGSRDLAPVQGTGAFAFCRQCLLVQRQEPRLAGGISASALGSVDRLIERHALGRGSLVVGVDAAPLLERIAEHGIPVLAIEQGRAGAAEARATGIPVVEAHFGPELAEGLAAAGRCADLVVVPAFGRLEDPAGAAEALARLVAVDGAAELAFASAAEIVPLAAWAAAGAEATLPTLRLVGELLEAEGLHLNDAGRAGRHPLLRASASTERRCTGRLAGLLDEERRVGAHAARFYSGGAPDFAAPRRTPTEEGAGAVT